MASYHCSVKVGAKGKAAAHASYICRQGKYTGYSRYEDMESQGQGNMPAWAQADPQKFWEASDEFERANGSSYREIEIALPRELNPKQRAELVEDFVRQQLGTRHSYQWAIHNPTAKLDGGEQPHAHIMYSERVQDGIERDPAQYFKRYNAKEPAKGGCRKDSAGTAERLEATRKLCADIQNEHLEHYGHAARVDHRSYKERGIERTPEQHLGPVKIKRMSDDDMAALLENRHAQNDQAQAQQAVSFLDLSGDIAAAKAYRDKQELLVLGQQIMDENREEIWNLLGQFKKDMLAKIEAEKQERREKELKAQRELEQRQERERLVREARRAPSPSIEREYKPPERDRGMDLEM